MTKRKKRTFKWIATMIIVIIALSYNLQETKTSTVQLEGLEIPVAKSQQHQILQRTGYTLSYHPKYLTPQWVAWELTKEETKGNAERNNTFYTDKEIIGTQANTSDYSNSGYDRGHMAPAGDMKWSKKAMKESFYMSNICPQNHNLNKGDWNELEAKTRTWAKRYGKAYIVCGPIYHKGKRIEHIGKNRIAVPHAFFKAILIYQKDTPMAMGFYFENKTNYQKLENYLTSINYLEELTGLDFFSALPDDIENYIEDIIPQELP